MNSKATALESRDPRAVKALQGTDPNRCSMILVLPSNPSNRFVTGLAEASRLYLAAGDIARVGTSRSINRGPR